jgi:N-acetylglucosamine transport system permease protein
VTICTIVLAILFATLLQRGNFKGNNFFRIIFYIPNILSIVVIAGIFGAIYNPTTGLLNTFLRAIGLDALARNWMSESNIVIYSVIFALVWQAIGYYMVMYMASMAAIPPDYYEAASLDGATELQMFSKITFPLIWSNIRTTLTFYIISTINLSFLFVQIMSDGGPNGKTEVFLNYMYKQAYGNGAYGYGMAIGVVVFIFSFVLSGIVNKITDREVYEF